MAAALVTVALAGCTDNDKDDRAGGGRAGGNETALKPFTAADAKFTASFPSTPERSDQQVPAGGATLRLVMYSSEVDDESGYSVGWFQLAAAPAAEGMNVFLEATRDGSVSAIKGKLVSSAFVTHDGLPAVEYTAAGPQGQYVKCRIVVRGRDVYVVQLASSSPDPPGYSEFVDSFAVTT